jgi:hypothetical protein
MHCRVVLYLDQGGGASRHRATAALAPRSALGAPARSGAAVAPSLKPADDLYGLPGDVHQTEHTTQLNR